MSVGKGYRNRRDYGLVFVYISCFGVSMSALDDFLRLLQLQCHVYHNQQICGDWLLEEHELGQTCFHLVSPEMSCYFRARFGTGWFRSRRRDVRGNATP